MRATWSLRHQDWSRREVNLHLHQLFQVKSATFQGRGLWGKRQTSLMSLKSFSRKNSKVRSGCQVCETLAKKALLLRATTSSSCSHNSAVECSAFLVALSLRGTRRKAGHQMPKMDSSATPKCCTLGIRAKCVNFQSQVEPSQLTNMSSGNRKLIRRRNTSTLSIQSVALQPVGSVGVAALREEGARSRGTLASESQCTSSS